MRVPYLGQIRTWVAALLSRVGSLCFDVSARLDPIEPPAGLCERLVDRLKAERVSWPVTHGEAVVAAYVARTNEPVYSLTLPRGLTLMAAQPLVTRTH